MNDIWIWIVANRAWLFEGAGVAIILTVIGLIFGKASKSRDQVQKGGHGSTNVQIGGDLKINSDERK